MELPISAAHFHSESKRYVPMIVTHSDRRWVLLIREGDEKAFESLFRKYYIKLVNFAFGYVKCLNESEELVQDVFADCWDNKTKLDPEKSIKSFLFQCTKYKTLDALKHKEVENRYRSSLWSGGYIMEDSEDRDKLDNEAFEKAVQLAIQSLPKKARQVYVLHRKEQLTYKEIAEVMGISPKTVESQMSRALKTLRIRLQKFEKFR